MEDVFVEVVAICRDQSVSICSTDIPPKGLGLLSDIWMHRTIHCSIHSVIYASETALSHVGEVGSWTVTFQVTASALLIKASGNYLKEDFNWLQKPGGG